MKVIIVTHESFIGKGPAHELRDFLIGQSDELLFISHPLLYFKQDYERTSYSELYIKGIKQTVRLDNQNLPSVLSFIKDLIYTFIWSFKIKGKIDLFFGVDPLNALGGLVLKKIGKIKKVIYYSIDFSPKRFSNPILNYIYHEIEKLCIQNCDIVWVGTERTIRAWEENGYDTSKIKKYVIVPDGNHSKSIKFKPSSKINKNRLVYIGHIAKKQGIDLVLESLPKLQEKFKSLSFTVIGDGDYLEELKNKTKKSKIKNVYFKGYLKDKEAEKILLGSGIGIATYLPDRESFTLYSEAGKPKYYLGLGIPVVITKVPSISSEIDKSKAGKAIEYESYEFISAVERILGDYNLFRNNAIKLGLSYDWSEIFHKALKETL